MASGFFGSSYTFWGLHCDAGDHYPHEQRVALMVATDSDRDKIHAMVPTGTSPYEDATSDVPAPFLLDGSSDEQPEKPAGDE